MEEINRKKYICDGCEAKLNDLEILYTVHGAFCFYCHGPVKEIKVDAQ